MEIQDLEKELLKKDKWLFIKLEEQKGLIQKAAQTEHDYRIALAGHILVLKSEGNPATLIPDLAKGNKTIAKLKLERDIAESIADACKQAIYAIQSSMSGIQSLISAYKTDQQRANLMDGRTA